MNKPYSSSWLFDNNQRAIPSGVGVIFYYAIFLHGLKFFLYSVSHAFRDAVTWLVRWIFVRQLNVMFNKVTTPRDLCENVRVRVQQVIDHGSLVSSQLFSDRVSLGALLVNGCLARLAHRLGSQVRAVIVYDHVNGLCLLDIVALVVFPESVYVQ